MRPVVAFCVSFGAIWLFCADSAVVPRPPLFGKGGQPPRPKPTLHVGDAAPPLSIDKWLKGDPIKSFDEGKVYVLDFWATWCDPAIAAMPSLSRIQADYGSKGVTVVGVTTASQRPRNDEAKVSQFVASRGARMRYSAALCNDRTMHRAWVSAAAAPTLPCTFVVDKAGRIAYIGNPYALVEVVPKVVDGTWKGKSDADAMRAADVEFWEIRRKVRTDPQAAFRDFEAFEAKHPLRREALAEVKINMYLNAKRWDDAADLTRKVIAKAMADRDEHKLNNLRRYWTLPPLNPERKYMDLAIQAGEAALAASPERNPMMMLGMAETYFEAGMKEKGEAMGRQAVAESADGRAKEAVLRSLERLRENAARAAAKKDGREKSGGGS